MPKLKLFNQSSIDIAAIILGGKYTKANQSRLKNSTKKIVRSNGLTYLALFWINDEELLKRSEQKISTPFFLINNSFYTLAPKIV